MELDVFVGEAGCGKTYKWMNELKNYNNILIIVEDTVQKNFYKNKNLGHNVDIYSKDDLLNRKIFGKHYNLIILEESPEFVFSLPYILLDLGSPNGCRYIATVRSNIDLNIIKIKK